MTIDSANMSDKNCPLRNLEMVFQSIKIPKFSGGESAKTPLEVHLLEWMNERRVVDERTTDVPSYNTF